MSTDLPENDPSPSQRAASREGTPPCAHCGGRTRFAGGESTHDLYAERFLCTECGRETYRSFGRGSVS